MIVLSPVFGRQRLPVIPPGWPPEIITGIKNIFSENNRGIPFRDALNPYFLYYFLSTLFVIGSLKFVYPNWLIKLQSIQ